MATRKAPAPAMPIVKHIARICPITLIPVHSTLRGVLREEWNARAALPREQVPASTQQSTPPLRPGPIFGRILAIWCEYKDANGAALESDLLLPTAHTLLTADRPSGRPFFIGPRPAGEARQPGPECRVRHKRAPMTPRRLWTDCPAELGRGRIDSMAAGISRCWTQRLEQTTTGKRRPNTST